MLLTIRLASKVVNELRITRSLTPISVCGITEIIKLLELEAPESCTVQKKPGASLLFPCKIKSKGILMN